MRNLLTGKTVVIAAACLVAAMVLYASETGEPLLSFSVISDTHCDSDISSNNNTNLHIALHDLRRVNPNAAALILVGDITQHARDAEYDSFNQLLNLVPHAPVYPVMGNHDVRWLSGGYTVARVKYTAATKMPGPYFDRWIGGYHFIFLGTEKDLKDQAHLSDAQLSWLDAKLAENGAENKPVFIFLHQSLPNTSAGSYPSDKYCSSGYPDGVVQDGELRSILAKYPQSVFFTGHTHAAVDDPNSVIGVPGLATFVNASSTGHTAPSGGYGHSGESEGMVVDVFADRAVFRGRNLARHLWVRKWTINYASPPEFPVTIDQETYLSYLDALKIKDYQKKDEIDILKKVAEENPKNMNALKKITRSCIGMRDYDCVHDNAKKLVALDPTDDNLFYYGRLFFDMGRYDLSIFYFSEGYAKSDNKAYMKWLADAYRKTGDAGKAEQCLGRLKGCIEIPGNGWVIAHVDSEETKARNTGAKNCIDGNDRTHWITEWKAKTVPCPHEIIIDLGGVYTIAGFSYLPRQDGGYDGDIGEFELYASADGTWNNPCVVKGKFPRSKIEKIVVFYNRAAGRYVKLVALSESNGKKNYTSAAEIKFYTDKSRQ